MISQETSIKKALNKAYLKVAINRQDFDNFKINLEQLVKGINTQESEEFHKNLIADFLKNSYYSPQHFINTKERYDLVIHTGKDTTTKVGVITASIPDNKNYLLVDTINQITLNEKFNPNFIWAILHSILINWYAYRFVFAKAIRTMHFDNFTTSKIPIPKIINNNLIKIIEQKVILVLNNKKNDPQADTRELEREIDLLVYELYGLTEEEIKLIES